MLTKLIDTSRVRFRTDFEKMALVIDLHRRLPRLKHNQRPSEATAFLVDVENGVYNDSFEFRVSYGIIGIVGEFIHLNGEPKTYSSEELPYLDRSY